MDEILTMHRNKVHELNQSRNTYGIFHHLFPQLLKYEDKFIEFLRMRKETFFYILEKIRSDLEKDWCNLHNQPILPEEQLVLTIRFLATGMSYRDLSFEFRIGKSTICEITRKTMKVLWDRLYPLHMKPPTKEEFKEIAQEFYNIHRFPHCLGAIDVRHIRIKQPAKSGSLYWNYKKFFSITLQAVVDAKFRYISIDVGGYGGQHDSTTLKHSSFYEALERNIIQIPRPDTLPHSDTVMHYFFIGDGAYPLMQHIMKPYPGEKLSEDESIYNKSFSGTRSVVECAFGQDCRRWGIYNKRIECPPKTVKLIACATCVLHNVIIDIEKNNYLVEAQEKTENIEKLEMIKLEEEDEEIVQEGFPVGDGQMIRKKLKEYLVKRYRQRRLKK